MEDSIVGGRSSCDASGVENLTLHSTRHTFISLARRGGARKDVVEQITHNAKGDIVDAYTTWDWKPLCEAVQCLNLESEADDADSDEDSEEEKLEKGSGGAGNRMRFLPVTKRHETSWIARNRPRKSSQVVTIHHRQNRNPTKRCASRSTPPLTPAMSTERPRCSTY